MNILASQDPAVAAAIDAEFQRQQDGLEMIASENYTSPAVMQAVGSVLTNKYAEGYPGRRYYGGCEHVDTIERLAIERVCQLFGSEAANVQPHSGSQANTAVYLAARRTAQVIHASRHGRRALIENRRRASDSRPAGALPPEWADPSWAQPPPPLQPDPERRPGAEPGER